MLLTTSHLQTIPRTELESLIRSGSLDETIPKISAMHGCNQAPHCHAEGDVATHTAYVVENAQRITQSANLSTQDKEAILWAALLHDWGKPFTQQIKDSTVTFPGHEAFAGSRIAQILAKTSLSLTSQGTVGWLVSSHGIAGAYPTLSQESRNFILTHPALELLLCLHEADHRACFTPPFPGGGHLPVYSEAIRSHAAAATASLLLDPACPP